MKEKLLSLNVFYIKFNINKLKLIYKIIITWREEKQRGLRALIRHPQNHGKSNLNLRTSIVSHREIDTRDFLMKIIFS